jgi:hypothetical protein
MTPPGKGLAAFAALFLPLGGTFCGFGASKKRKELFGGRPRERISIGRRLDFSTFFGCFSFPLHRTLLDLFSQKT